MAGKTISTSPNIAVLDSRIFGDTCEGIFTVDATPSVFIGGGASSVLGAKVKITNPYDVVIKDYLAGYDIAAPLTAAYEHDIPTQAGKIQYGIYTIALQITDADGATYEIIKKINVCTYTDASHPCDERLRVVADCKNGRVTVTLTEPPVFRGIYSQSQTVEITVDYPTASGLAQLVSSYGNFSMQLFQGEYKIVAEVCATYDFGDNVYLRLHYDVTMYKNVKCLLDYTCIWPRIKQLNDKIDSNCSQKQKEEYSLVVLDALRLLKTAELANDAGEDASDYINALEKLLGCQCTCDCSGSPIVNGTPSTNVAIEGCGVTKETVGLTDVYTIDAVRYFLTLATNEDVLTLSAVSEYGCTIYQAIGFNAGNAYLKMKAQVNNTTEYNFWAGVVNNSLASLDATCLGYNSEQWAALTFAQKIQALIAVACAGGKCITSVSGVSANQQGADVLISFTQSGGYNSDVYVDGVLKGTVLSGVGELLVSGYADGLEHDYAVIPKCSNGSQGTAFSGTFGFLACPSISPPTVSSNNVNGVECPYDLTALVSTPPVGIETEWHTANNTNAGTLVGDPTAVSSGVYYAFAKDANGCYSAATVVTLICDGETSCTAPQNLLVVDGVGGFKISFQSAAYPPPSNSYTVKRKAAADPDVDGSYTTIGTPVWNSSTSRWEITDATGSDNTLYTYKAISNCASTTPSVLYNFANLDCPSLSLTPDATTIAYEFANVGGQVDKYEVSIYDSTGSVEITKHTIVPAFSSPIEGLFEYLTEGTTYKIRAKVFIGTFSKTCDFVSAITSSGDSVVNWSFVETNPAGGSLTIIKNGDVVVSALNNSSGSFNCDEGDSISVSVTGASGVTRELTVENATTATELYHSSGIGDEGFAFSVDATTSYTIIGEVYPSE